MAQSAPINPGNLVAPSLLTQQAGGSTFNVHEWCWYMNKMFPDFQCPAVDALGSPEAATADDPGGWSKKVTAETFLNRLRNYFEGQTTIPAGGTNQVNGGSTTVGGTTQTPTTAAGSNPGNGNVNTTATSTASGMPLNAILIVMAVAVIAFVVWKKRG